MTYAQRLNHVRDLFRAARYATSAGERVFRLAATRKAIAEARATIHTTLANASPELAVLAEGALTELDALEKLIDKFAAEKAKPPFE